MALLGLARWCCRGVGSVATAFLLAAGFGRVEIGELDVHPLFRCRPSPRGQGVRAIGALVGSGQRWLEAARPQAMGANDVRLNGVQHESCLQMEPRQQAQYDAERPVELLRVPDLVREQERT